MFGSIYLELFQEVEVEREKNMDAPTLTEMSEAPSDTLEPVAGGFSDTEAQALIQAVEPILKNVRKSNQT